MTSKRKVAVFLHGGIGTGHFAQGYPMLEKILVGLSLEFEITVFSQWSAHPEFASEHFSFIAPNPKYKRGWLRWLVLITLFLKANRRQSFDQLLAFWGFPPGFIATLLSKLFGIRATVCLMGGDATGIKKINFGILHRPLLKFLALWAYRRADNLIALTEFQARHVKQYGIKRPIIIIPWGPDLEMFPIHERMELNQIDGEEHQLRPVLHCLHVAHLSPVKDQFTLVKAFAEIARAIPAELRIIGGDTMFGAVQRFCRELQLEGRVTFLDMVPYAEMQGQYQWADCLLHTSLYEGQSMGLTEAAASGVLLAGTRVGLLHDLGDRCGIVVEQGDYLSLAQQLLRIRNEQLAWNEKVSEARQWCVTHNLSWTIKQFSGQLRS